METTIEVRRELAKTGGYLTDKGLAWGSAGNLSAKTDDGQFLITASGTYLGELSDRDFVECPIHGDGANGSGKPSKEWPMHQAIYQERPEISAVLHASPFYGTLAACSDLEVPSDLFVETMYELERVERVPYAHPGSMNLAEEVRKRAGKANVLLLENHGVLVYDKSIKEARTAIEVLEMACRMIVTASQSGVTLKRLSSEVVRSFLEDSGYKPRRRWQDS
ncbi:MAG TPA: class II aldolase/adducin family protein [Bacillales bacterium]|nr:class II aldolase/adducin family protein [Bacillales bacterium]